MVKKAQAGGGQLVVKSHVWRMWFFCSTRAAVDLGNLRASVAGLVPNGRQTQVLLLLEGHV